MHFSTVAGKPAEVNAMIRAAFDSRCPTCRQHYHIPMSVLERHTRGDDDAFSLDRVILPDGKILEEFVQEDISAEDGVCYIGVRMFHKEDDNTLTLVKEFLWPTDPTLRTKR